MHSVGLNYCSVCALQITIILRQHIKCDAGGAASSFAVANLIAVQGYKISTTAHFTNFAHALYRVKVGIAATMRFVKNWALVIKEIC